MALETLKDVSEDLYRRYRWVRERIPIESGNYAYVTARVKAKRGLLMPGETYGRLLQMSIPEIARFLGEREYKDEMVALGARYAGVDLIEMATSRSLAKTYTQIYEFCEGDLRTMVARYLDRWDLENVKTIVRGKVHGAATREIEEDLVAAGSLREEFLRDLVAADRLEDVFGDLEGTIYTRALESLGKRPAQATNWAAWEDLVSKLYYEELLDAIPPSTEANRLMREFVRREIDIVNLKTLLRAWAAKAAFERPIFLAGGRELDVPDLEEIVALDHAGLTKRLSEYSFYPRIAEDLARVQTTGVGVLVRRVEKVHLVEAARYGHLHPLSILPILDFIVRKDREVQNIRLVARGKESGLSTDVIRDLLVV
jgi:V/A-type H+-transporting ATPase subunit C